MPKTNIPRLFTNDELAAIIKDDKRCASFGLSEKERHILELHIIEGVSFTAIGVIYGVSRQRIYSIYVKTVRRMKIQTLTILRDRSQS